MPIAALIFIHFKMDRRESYQKSIAFLLHFRHLAGLNYHIFGLFWIRSDCGVFCGGKKRSGAVNLQWIVHVLWCNTLLQGQTWDLTHVLSDVLNGVIWKAMTLLLVDELIHVQLQMKGFAAFLLLNALDFFVLRSRCREVKRVGEVTDMQICYFFNDVILELFLLIMLFLFLHIFAIWL